MRVVAVATDWPSEPVNSPLAASAGNIRGFSSSILAGADIGEYVAASLLASPGIRMRDSEATLAPTESASPPAPAPAPPPAAAAVMVRASAGSWDRTEVGVATEAVSDTSGMEVPLRVGVWPTTANGVLELKVVGGADFTDTLPLGGAAAAPFTEDSNLYCTAWLKWSLMS